MTDRELLELAAKAAGYSLKWGDVYIVCDTDVDCTDQPYVVSGQPDEADWYWDPLADDGDAFRLAVKLRIDVHHSTTMVVAERDTAFDRFEVGVAELKGDDDFSATRRAIVRAAAEIGKAMP